MKKIYLIAFMIVFLVGLISATDYIPHKQTTDFDLVVTSNNGTSCNLSIIQYANGDSNILNQELTKNGQTFYATIDKTNFTQIGDVCMNVVCTDTLTYETGSVCRAVSPSGFTGTLGFYILILILSLGIVVLGFYMEDATIIILGSFGLGFVGLYILFNGIDGMKDATYTWAIGLIILMLGSYLSVKASSEMLN